MKILLQVLMFLLFLFGVGYCDIDVSRLEKVLSQLEIDLSLVDYDISKLPPETAWRAIVILTPDCQIVYPRKAELSDEKDYDGRLFVKEIIDMAMRADGEFIQYKYRWQNKESPQIITKLLLAKYIKMHGIIIGTSEAVDLLDRTEVLKKEVEELMDKYFYEVEKNGVDHADSQAVYVELRKLVDSIPNRIKTKNETREGGKKSY